MGPPGAGKTALVSSYLAARRRHELWYEIDARDEDVAGFFYYLHLAAKRRAPRRVRPPLFTAEYRLGLPAFSRAFFELLFSMTRVLVLDNYQELSEEAALQEVLREGIGAIPGGRRVIVLSRSAPPPALTRFRATGEMALLGWEDLRLDRKEARQLLERRHARLSRGEVQALHERTEGWAAGLVLLAENGALAGPTGAPPMERVFEYFTGEILERAPKPTRKLLVETALLPPFTAEMAEALTGVRRADSVLSGLSRRHSFIERRAGAETTYQYHGLFREFLRERARQELRAARIRTVQRRAATLLAAAGKPEDAADLLVHSQDVAGLTKLVLREARALFSQGREETLRVWLHALPEEVRRESGWLSYWWAMCLLFHDPASSLLELERAFALFERQGLMTGTLLAWRGIVDAIFFGWNSVAPFDRWIEWLESRLREGLVFPSPEIETLVVSGMASAVCYRQCDRPEARTWLLRAVDLSRQEPASDMHVYNLTRLAVYLHWLGESASLRPVLEELGRVARLPQVSPATRLLSRSAEAMSHFFAGDDARCLAEIHEGVKAAESWGLDAVAAPLLWVGVCAALSSGDRQECLRLLEAYGGQPRPGALVRASLAWFRGWLALLEGRGVDARTEAEQCLRLAPDVGTPYFDALARLAMGHAWEACGRSPESREEIARVRAIGAQMKSVHLEFQALLLGASVAFADGDDEDGLRSLAAAMALGRENGYMNTFYWRPDRMAELCVRALTAGIEAPYVRDLVRKRGLVPREVPARCTGWPWPLRISTLGSFEVQRDGEATRWAGKAQVRPWLLLQALVAFGGRGVKLTALAEALWPQSDGDTAQQALATTLHRTRRLLGSEGLIIQREGRLSLDPRQVWVDAWAFEQELDRARREGLEPLKSALHFYRGSFLPETDEPWAEPVRERLRGRFRRAALELGRLHEEAQRWRDAVEVYLHGLEADGLAEELYQRLIVCYRHLGLRTEALAAYELCKRRLDADLGLAPSAETEGLVRSLGSRASGL
jgi:DNA-binding SARP family transcriptional activator